MDLPSLVVILQAALSPNPVERKAAEESLNQVFADFFPLILIIISDWMINNFAEIIIIFS